MSRHQTAGQNDFFKRANKSFANVAKFKHLRKTVRNKNCITEQLRADYIRGMLATMQFRIFCLPVGYLCRCENVSVTLREEHRLRVKIAVFCDRPDDGGSKDL
jgi:hypothetical protein